MNPSDLKDGADDCEQPFMDPAECRESAKSGNAEARYRMGLLYERGDGVDQSDSDASVWYGMAAEQGHAKAQYRIGLMYEEGRGVVESIPKAMKWYTEAAGQGYAEAQFKLGSMYENGIGVPRSDSDAKGWYIKAAEQGNQQAIVQCKDIAEKGDIGAQLCMGRVCESRLYSSDPCEDYDEGFDEEAAEWYAMAAEQGDPEAMCRLGSMYEEGRGVGQSDEEAAELYIKAAEQEYEEAVEWCTEVGSESNARVQCYLGRLCEGDYSYTEAREWYHEAGMNGDPEAQYRLGLIYEEGKGVSPSDSRAMMWFGRALIQGYGEAIEHCMQDRWIQNATVQYYLGKLYEEGRGVPQSDTEAREYYVKAARHGIQGAVDWCNSHGIAF